ncbi:MAG: hypothetical protein IKL87_02995 [Oscillospiraceae bacterium]|nr:hypothetical protein [Oscillospiraceae bacterium]
MANEVLRTAFMGGYVKEDVLAYIDQQNMMLYNLEEENKRLQKELDEAKRQLAAAQNGGSIFG